MRAALVEVLELDVGEGELLLRRLLPLPLEEVPVLSQPVVEGDLVHGAGELGAAGA